jgi:hypothetical protein
MAPDRETEELKMSRLTRAKIREQMWGAGMPSTDDKYADVFFAGLKAGLDQDQAFALACQAFSASRTYVDNLARHANWLRRATLERKAAESPVGLYAYVKHVKGGAYPYVTDDQIRDIHHNDFAGWSAWSDAQRAAA